MHAQTTNVRTVLHHSNKETHVYACAQLSTVVHSVKHSKMRVKITHV